MVDTLITVMDQGVITRRLRCKIEEALQLLLDAPALLSPTMAGLLGIVDRCRAGAF